jgi:hypothetical protein
MAVDTAQKRRSMISFGDMQYGERVPAATNLDSQSDRYNEVFLFSGFDSGGETTIPSGGGASNTFWFFRRRRR